MSCASIASAQSTPGPTFTVIEFYNTSLDHYFISPLAADLDALDSGRLPGWIRTGRTFAAWPTAAAGGALASPVCRYYIPPAKGDSHFFSASPAECADVARRIQSEAAFAGITLESPNAFYAALSDLASGACPAGTVPVFRLWNRRADSNHRYTTDPALRDEMIARGYVPEGFGPGVAMCAPSDAAAVQVKVSDTTPFPANCHMSGGTLFTNAEVEPYLAINPINANNLVAVWQQDRWSNGGARGTLTGVSFDGGRSWEKRQVPFSRCSGGNASNGGDYDRATDPWVTFAADGTAHQVALSLTGGSFTSGSTNAINVSRSNDGGRSWTNPIALIVDGEDFFNDKEAITADPVDARLVYVSWDRLARGGGGPAYFARTIDGGLSWESARSIFDPGRNAQTINNIPVVLPDGTLFNFFSQINFVGGRNVATLQLMRSPDKGVTWETPIAIAPQQAIGVRDPQTQTPVRDATLLGSIAVSRAGHIAVVWQDARFSGGLRDGIAFARSVDGGRTWSAPVQVNRDAGVPAFIPTVAFRDDGTVGVTYYDFRSNTPSSTELATDYWLAQSTDGITWRERRVAAPFDLSIAANANGLFIGDYMSLRTRGSEFVALFGVTNNGNTSNRSDIAIAFIEAPAAAVAKRLDDRDVDPTMYRVQEAPQLVIEGEIAMRHDAAIRAALERRLARPLSSSEPGAVR
ncbi:MAG TPA: sialidase family protein [Casimicrobiaceae bacterium]|nr:sialidase family protein [Casimicrobiaceae bacterium]